MDRVLPSVIPAGLKPYFQEYNIALLEIEHDANLTIQRIFQGAYLAMEMD